jgi:hypothetical protein
MVRDQEHDPHTIKAKAIVPDPTVVTHEVRYVSDGDTATARESELIVGTGEGNRIEKITVGRDGPDRRVVDANLGPDGAIVNRVEGRGPLTKESELRAAHVLVTALQEQGEPWRMPELWPDDRPEVGVDCFAEGPDGARLLIQVTTADPQLWGELARAHGSLESTLTVEELADRVVRAVEAKVDKRYDDVAALTLVVDATDAPAMAMASVVEVIRKLHAERIARSGFEKIWLVGPTSPLVYRLDGRDTHASPTSTGAP